MTKEITCQCVHWVRGRGKVVSYSDVPIGYYLLVSGLEERI
jgi:hypothetical protein